MELTPLPGQPSPGEGAPPPPGSDLVPVLQRVVQWDRTSGTPVVKTVSVFTQKQIVDVMHAAAASAYTGKEPQYRGWTNLEVMVDKRIRHAAESGITDEIDGILDRLAGKPKTTAEVTHRRMTYEDRLRDIEKAEAMDAEVVSPSPAPVENDDNAAPQLAENDDLLDGIL